MHKFDKKNTDKLGAEVEEFREKVILDGHEFINKARELIQHLTPMTPAALIAPLQSWLDYAESLMAEVRQATTSTFPVWGLLFQRHKDGLKEIVDFYKPSRANMGWTGWQKEIAMKWLDQMIKDGRQAKSYEWYVEQATEEIKAEIEKRGKDGS